ncbi:oxidoreductase [Tropicimonas marinistellae]|uniref:oxidoreductase n=1 Tax=Tropicimonas marinistellae TaxID=1739787 RepID=UPI00082F8D2D|nr:oxidoreductase [Tropicimonas marinistellae]
MARPYKTALVTGASSGMGKDIAHRLLKEGFTTYVAARSTDKMADLAEAGAIVLEMDITKDDQITATAARIHAETGGVDVLVNNAGYGQYGPVEDTPIDTARYQFEVNLFGLARLTQLLLPDMREKKQGLIVNISSMGGKIYTPLGAWYHATKHALEGWSDCLRLELKPHGIDVVIVEPGLIDTGFAGAVSSNFSQTEGSAYATLIGALMKSAEGGSLRGSPPSVISDVVLKAIRADRPRTRYAAGSMARPSLFLRWLVSDRMFDRIIMSQFT